MSRRQAIADARSTGPRAHPRPKLNTERGRFIGSRAAHIAADMVGHPAAGLVASVAPERVAMRARCQPDLAGERAFVRPGPAQAR